MTPTRVPASIAPCGFRRRAPGGRGRPAAAGVRRTLVLVLAVALAGALTTGAATAALAQSEAQLPAGPVMVWRDQFPQAAGAPATPLAAEPPTVLTDGRSAAAGVDALLVRSPDPEVAAVFRLEPADEGAAGLRLRVIVLTSDGAKRYQYKYDGTVLEAGGRAPQRIFRVGERGLLASLAGGGERVAQVLIQDDGDAELRLSREGTRLVLDVIPAAYGGDPSGTRPYYLGQGLRFVDYGLLVSGYRKNVLGELWLAERLSGQANWLTSDEKEVLLLRASATGQAWRSHAWAVWAQGGVGYLRITEGGVTTETVHAAGGVTVHWRHGAWGAAAHAGRVGSTTVLSVLGGWQALDWLGVVASWQQLEGRSGYGLGAALDF